MGLRSMPWKWAMTKKVEDERLPERINDAGIHL
jgi:hypothetical protein